MQQSPKFFTNSGENDDFISPPPIPEEAHNDESHSSRIHPDRVPDLSFLSANFSSESIDASAQPSTPSRAPLFASAYTSAPDENNITKTTLSAPFSRRNSNSFQNGNLPSPPVGRFSHLHHQRTGSNQNAARPKSMLVYDTSMAPAIFENDDINEDLYKNDTHRKRNSFHFASRPQSFHQHIPQSQPPSLSATDSRHARARSRSSSPVRMSTSPQRKSHSPIRKPPSPTRAPFNFKPQEMPMMHSNSSNSSLVVKPAHRKGHRYKHSSVSMNLFQEPVPLADVNTQQNLIPDLYPIPNLLETWSSASSTQKYKAAFAGAHFVTSIVVFMAGANLNEASFSTLAHLVFYDSLGSMVVVFVDIMSNFEVWNNPSIAYPFGLGRLEVLTGFALSASLVMVGCDLVSHFVEEMVFSLAVKSPDDSAGHGAHHIHDTNGTTRSPILYALVLVLVMLMTWFTSTQIYDKGGISDMMSDQDTKGPGHLTGGPASKNDGILLGGQQSKDNHMKNVARLIRHIVKNPIRLLTLIYSMFLFLIPMLPESFIESMEFDLDEVSTLVVASFLCYAGWKLVNTLGGILLVSFPYADYDYHYLKATITDRILDLSCFKQSYSLDHCFLTKVNYQLYVVGAHIKMSGGSADEESRLIFEVNRVLNSTVKTFDSESSVEITIDIERS